MLVVITVIVDIDIVVEGTEIVVVVGIDPKTKSVDYQALKSFPKKANKTVSYQSP